MTVHETIARRPPPDPGAEAGGATVGDLRAMDGARALAILMFRDWFEGGCGQARVADLFEEALGAAAGPVATDAFGACLDGLGRHARRPLVRHALQCNCVGADEAVFAQLLESAATGAREDAMMILSLIVPGDRGVLLLREAEAAGLAIMRVARTMARGSTHTAPAATVSRPH